MFNFKILRVSPFKKDTLTLFLRKKKVLHNSWKFQSNSFFRSWIIAIFSTVTEWKCKNETKTSQNLCKNIFSIKLVPVTHFSKSLPVDSAWSEKSVQQNFWLFDVAGCYDVVMKSYNLLFKKYGRQRKILTRW